MDYSLTEKPEILTGYPIIIEINTVKNWNCTPVEAFGDFTGQKGG